MNVYGNMEKSCKTASTLPNHKLIYANYHELETCEIHRDAIGIMDEMDSQLLGEIVRIKHLQYPKKEGDD